MLLGLLRRAVALDTDLAEHCPHWAMLGSYRQRHCELRRGQVPQFVQFANQKKRWRRPAAGRLEQESAFSAPIRSE